MTSRPRTRRLSVLLAVAVLGIAASGVHVLATQAATPTLNGAVGVGGANITLRRNGANVTRLTAGTYNFSVRDASSEHNFHLKGPGVDRKTGVSTSGTAHWNSVRLRPGTYTFQCDPHAAAGMRHTFRVVAA